MGGKIRQPAHDTCLTARELLRAGAGAVAFITYLLVPYLVAVLVSI
jgi:hypothetical protein